MKLQEIPIAKIKITENHRTNLEATHLEELMQSIKHNGLKQPIGVSPAKGKGGAYILRFGQRRLLACKKLGHKVIMATVASVENDKELLVENLTENMQRRDPSFAELGRMIKKLEEDMGLSLKEIAVRLGIPIQKVNQIVSVYCALPEKYRKKVFFMEKGGGRNARKGSIPATVATKIAEMKKRHKLNDQALGGVVRATEQGMDSKDLNNVGSLVSSGMDIDRALKNAREYGVFTVDITIRYKEVTELMTEHGLAKRDHLFKKIVYGELPPLKKPDFVSTGYFIKKEKTVQKPRKVQMYAKMRTVLSMRAKTGNLTEEQKAALKGTKGLHPKMWTEAQCSQIKNMYEETAQ